MYLGCFVQPFYRVALYPLMQLFHNRNLRLLGAGLYGVYDDVELYHRHNEHVRKVVPKDQLLEFNPKDGWEPLCEFLGVPVPTDEHGRKTKYPHVNDTKNIRSSLLIYIAIGYISWIV